MDVLSSNEHDGDAIRNVRSGKSNKSEIPYYKHVNRLNKVNKSVYVRPKYSDYNVDNIDDGINEINATMDFLALDENIPEDLFEYVDKVYAFDVESFIDSNHKLRDQIKDIVVVCKAAITKAAAVKKTITTHRDPPADPVVKAKYKEIKNYQHTIETCKQYINNLQIKVDTLDDPKTIGHKGTIKKIN
jgi:rhodanese-related sulfurtransferase